MSRWWRAYDEAVDDPKLQRLSLPLFKSWFNICCIASKNDGVLPPIGDVAFKLHLTEHKAAEVITALVTADLIDLREDGKFEPHNWEKRQFKSDVTDPTAATRMKRYRENRKGVTENTVTVTPTREQTTETDKKEPSLRSVPDPAGFEKFWTAYPKRVGRKEAAKAYAKALKETTPEAIIGAVEKQKRSWNDPKFIPHPATWLNRGSWQDEPAGADNNWLQAIV